MKKGRLRVDADWKGSRHKYLMKVKLRKIALAVAILAILAGIPLGVLSYQSSRTGKSWWQIVRRSAVQVAGLESRSPDESFQAPPKGKKIDFLDPRPIGDDFEDPPRISHVLAVDLDQDGLLDVVVCDCQAQRVSWIRQSPLGEFSERVCADGLIAPAHVEAVDFDFDGDLDLMVAVLGMLYPNNDKIGSVVILENDGQANFTKHVVIDRVARVSDVRAGDLDGDGDLDLAVAQFGYDDGQTRWIENLGQWQFKSHLLQHLAGPIHSEIVDIDQDGDLDIVVLVSQEFEEIYVFEGNGSGAFQPRLIFASDNEDYGSSGMWIYDLDSDGDSDILYTNGDAFDYHPPVGRPWHGVQWLENMGNLTFRFHRIANFGGAVNATPADIDHDGDLDLFVASTWNTWDDPRSQSLIWLENDGKMRFRRHDLANTPTHVMAMDTGDFNQDGEIDLVTGGMHVFRPFDRMERIVLWMNIWPKVQPH